MKILAVFGTRPEAIKLFPVVHELQRTPGIDCRVCVTGQHREMVRELLQFAGIAPDIDLDILKPEQSLDQLTATLLLRVGETLDAEQPDRVIVQGDTATAMTASLAAYYRRIQVAHVEAGLRSGDIHHPWPEEVNRKIITAIADRHFAPTEAAHAALLGEGVAADAVTVTGNTVIDALHWTRHRIAVQPGLASTINPILDEFGDRRIIAVTVHRRENVGELPGIIDALATIACRTDVAIVLPMHPNPAVRAPLSQALSGIETVALIEPLDYPNFVRLLDRCHIVLTDSGGVQEEAPAFGKPVLVMRTTTERPEGIAAGTARLVGTEAAAIIGNVDRLLDDAGAYKSMARAHNPYGDGQSARRIAEALAVVVS